MRASGGQANPDEPSASAERLTGLGLPRSPTGWVPEQPSLPAPEHPESVIETPDQPAIPRSAPAPAPAPAPTSITELLRAAAADRAPVWAGRLIERATIGGVVAVIAAVILVIVGGVMLVHRQQASGAASYSSSTYSGSADSPAPDPVPSANDATSIVVDVGGRVRKPGLVTLPMGARVADAIDAAGGPLHRRELDRIDLAQRVTDGQLLLVGVQPSASAAGDATGAAATDPATPVSLSAASLDQLETLPGVGPVTAQKIVDYRTAHGGFTSVEQLQQVSGIGPAHYAEISPLVTP